MTRLLTAERLTVPRRLLGISATLTPGTITAICGPNGAGKSTLLAALAGLLEPDGGQVLLDGQALGELHPRQRARKIGYLPQQGEVAWDVPVRVLAALGRLPHGDAGEGEVAAALAAVGLTALAGRRVSTLSGGERARAFLARVLAGTPQWILADEPLAALDLAHQLALLRHLRHAADAGAGVVLVLHDLAMAMNHADRVLVLDRGELVADGPPDQALAPARITQAWGVTGRWLGEHGGRALVLE
ncbi:MAG: ABC transporter ATP-binding protein [Croceibacterium sp.]